ncbi:MAG: histidine phosphatase family protein [Chloroflexi bacterium]|nr:histidine phosphatase family protein [Chloroflexota bacterium]
MRLLLVRHGESLGNVAQRIQGLCDQPLTERGRTQARALAQRLLDGYEVCAIYTSPLSRARETAEIIAALLDVTVITDDRLREYDCGVVTGLCYEEVQSQYPEIARRWAEDSWHVPIPGEEGIDTFQARVLAVMGDIVSQHATKDTVGIVAHGGTLSVYLAGLLEMGLNRRQPWVFDNASLSIVTLGGTRPRIALLNDTCHLHHMQEKNTI